jgi:hypothetical protein
MLRNLHVSFTAQRRTRDAAAMLELTRLLPAPPTDA